MNMKKNFLTMLLALALCSSTFAQWKPAGDKIKTTDHGQIQTPIFMPVTKSRHRGENSLTLKTYCRNIRVLSWSATTGKT